MHHVVEHLVDRIRADGPDSLSIDQGDIQAARAKLLALRQVDEAYEGFDSWLRLGAVLESHRGTFRSAEPFRAALIELAQHVLDLARASGAAADRYRASVSRELARNTARPAQTAKLETPQAGGIRRRDPNPRKKQ